MKTKKRWKPSIKIRFIRSRGDYGSPRADDAWGAWYFEHLACPRNYYELNRDWRDNPKPINVLLKEQPQGVISGVAGESLPMKVLLRATKSPQRFHGAPIDLFRRDFAEALGLHLNGMLIGSVRVVQQAGRPKDSGYVSVLVPPKLSIEPFRAGEGAHAECAMCGQICSLHWRAEGIVERSLAGRRFWGSLANSAFYIDESLAQELDLRKRFPDLMLVSDPVIEEPLDGDVLPGDPGWDGTFRPQIAKARKLVDREHWPDYGLVAPKPKRSR